MTEHEILSLSSQLLTELDT